MVRLARSFLRSPGRTGSVWPASRRLVRALTDLAFRRSPRLVVEVGAGDGVVTRALVERAAMTGARVFAIDVNRELLRDNSVHGVLAQVDAEHLPLRRADVVVSSLPFGSLSREKTDAILHELAGLGGSFVLYQYTTRRFDLIRRHFPAVAVEGRVLLNLPPAYVLASPPAAPAPGISAATDEALEAASRAGAAHAPASTDA